MANNFEDSDSIILPEVRLDFFDIWTPGAPMKESDKANLKKWKFKVKAIFPIDSEADKRAKAAMGVAARKLWGDNAGNVIKTITKNSLALRDGDDNLDTSGAVREAYKGMKYVSASNGNKPMIVGPRRVVQDAQTGAWRIATQAEIDARLAQYVTIGQDGKGYVNGLELGTPPYEIIAPYRGCYVNLKLRFTAGKSFKFPDGEQAPNQIFGKLEAVQFLRDGIAFAGGGSNSAEGFDEVGEVETAAAGADNLFN